MHFMKHTSLVAVLAGFGLFGTGTKAQAYDYHHIDQNAIRLQRQTEYLHKEVHAHFRHTPSYRHLDADVTQMERLARHIHDVAHRRGSIAHLRHDVEKLDKLFHHVEGLVRSMRLTGRIDYRTYRHLRSSLSGISRTLHDLRDDIFHADLHRGDPHFGHGHSGVNVRPIIPRRTSGLRNLGGLGRSGYRH